MYVGIGLGIMYSSVVVAAVIWGVRRHRKRESMIKHYGTDHSSMTSNFSLLVH